MGSFQSIPTIVKYTRPDEGNSIVVNRNSTFHVFCGVSNGNIVFNLIPALIGEIVFPFRNGQQFAFVNDSSDMTDIAVATQLGPLGFPIRAVDFVGTSLSLEFIVLKYSQSATLTFTVIEQENSFRVIEAFWTLKSYPLFPTTA